VKRLLRRASSVIPSGWALFGGGDAWFLSPRGSCVATDFLSRLSTVATFALGGVWYGPLFSRAWRIAEGQTEHMTKKKAGHPAVV
jgi:hypothetical protein